MAFPQDEAPDEDDLFMDLVPFTQQRLSSSKLFNRPINFVRAGGNPTNSVTTTPRPMLSGLDVQRAYLAIVNPAALDKLPDPNPENYPICEICNGIIREDIAAHFFSAMHQLNLPVARVPSAIDRRRMGHRYLKKHGWDVDARKGLGIQEQGIPFPIETEERKRNLGLGAATREKREVKKEPKLNVREIRKQEKKDKRKHKKLNDDFYGNDKVTSYLAELEQGARA